MIPTPPPRPPFDRDRFRALVHYVCHAAPRPEALGATKLNKILLFSDREAYLRFGHSLTGETYVKRQHGPVPRHGQATISELECSGVLRVTRSSEAFVQTRYESLEAPKRGVFTDAERVLVDEQIDLICHHHTARSISALSHDAAWERAEMGEEIPYHSVYERFFRPPSEASKAWAQDFLHRFDKSA